MDVLAGRRTYLDTNILIYALEGHTRFALELTALLQGAQTGRPLLATSELTLAELLPDAIRKGDEARAAAYRQYLTSRSGFEVVPITRPVLERAATLRALSSLKLPDAIHVATAETNGCAVFLTNDERVSGASALEIVLLSRVVTP